MPTLQSQGDTEPEFVFNEIYISADSCDSLRDVTPSHPLVLTHLLTY